MKVTMTIAEVKRMWNVVNNLYSPKTLFAESIASLHVDKYLIHNRKFLSLSIMVDGARSLSFNVCVYSTKVEVFKIISVCLASGILLKNLTTSMAILLATSWSFPSAATR